MTVVETPAFLRAADPVLDEEERADLVGFVATNPAVGDVIPQTGGVRKLRWATKGKGKRGGVRVIYYFHKETIPVFLLDIYAKNVKENLTKAERNTLRKRIPLLVEEYQRRNIR
ncbi:MAG: type II toxin-antitoxin system RelE/ParE family toxin [Acidobacteria bacterium]|nr:type II toxin-antitoxin system RelE/ParE family toxin [Acidobacteriota bacterium]